MSSAKTLLFFVSTLLIVSVCRSQIDLLYGPLLTGSTVFSVVTSTTTITRATPCFVPYNDESLNICRRKRGIQERPEILQPRQEFIVPTFVRSIEASREPSFLPIARTLNNYQAEVIQSSFDDNQRHPFSHFNHLGARARDSLITVGNCGGMVLNFSQFLSCVGLTVQETTTLRATFTASETVTIGYTTMTVAGCTPPGFPYMRCPSPDEVAPTSTSLPVPETSSITSDDIPPVLVEKDGVPDERD